MLSLLRIENLLLIEKVELRFKPGLNTVTGETGVGKSVILDCLGFALGWNNSGNLLRVGAESGEVIAEFLISKTNEINYFLRKSGIPNSDTIIIRRLINRSETRKKTFLNDKLISVDFLQNITKYLIELQTQNETQTLLNKKNHGICLDTFANVGSQIKELQDLWRKISKVEKSLNENRKLATNIKMQREYLEASVAEIKNLNVKENEEQYLLHKRRTLKGLLDNKDKFERVNDLLIESGFENSLIDSLKLLESLRTVIGDKLDKSIEGLERTLTEFGSSLSELSKIATFESEDLNRIEEIEDRLHNLRRFSRKYDVDIADLSELASNMEEQLIELENIKIVVEDSEKSIQKLNKNFNQKAEILSKARQRAGHTLDNNVICELKDLRMPGCVFKTEISKCKPGPKGIDDIVFKVRTNRGGKLGNLTQIASGGEMSRFLLALKVCLSNKDDGVTMIFDEIDRGIGGATADAVGRRLRELSKLTQTIVVTHSPQVAAHGDHQWKVDKSQIDEANTRTSIKELTYEERLSEIARMISGKEISKEAKAAAKKLLG